MLGVLCDVLDGVPNGLDAPLPPVEPKLNAILYRREVRKVGKRNGFEVAR